jgi:hypothetical protein
MHKQMTAASVALTSSQSADAGWHLLIFCRVTSTGARVVLFSAAAHGVPVGAHGLVEQSVCHALGVPVVQNGFLASLLDEVPKTASCLRKLGNLDTLGTQLRLWGRRSAPKSADLQAAAIVKALRQGHQGCSDRAANEVTATVLGRTFRRPIVATTAMSRGLRAEAAIARALPSFMLSHGAATISGFRHVGLRAKAVTLAEGAGMMAASLDGVCFGGDPLGHDGGDAERGVAAVEFKTKH